MSPPPDQAALARASRRGAVTSVLGLLVLVGSVVYAQIHLVQAEEQKKRLDSEIKEKERQLKDVAARLEHATAELDEKLAALKQLAPVAQQGLGFKEQAPLLSFQALSRHAEAKQVAQSLAHSARSARPHPITIQYFPKLKDEVNVGVVLSTLEEAGFRLERKAAEVPGVPTNAVWFGSEVSVEDVKLVALTLASAGVQIRAVRTFRNPSARPYLIQIGADAALVGKSPMALEELIRAEDFSR